MSKCGNYICVVICFHLFYHCMQGAFLGFVHIWSSHVEPWRYNLHTVDNLLLQPRYKKNRMLHLFLIVIHILIDLWLCQMWHHFIVCWFILSINYIMNNLDMCQIVKRWSFLSIIYIIYTCIKLVHTSYSNQVCRMLGSQNKTLPLFQELTKHGGNLQI